MKKLLFYFMFVPTRYLSSDDCRIDKNKMVIALC